MRKSPRRTQVFACLDQMQNDLKSLMRELSSLLHIMMLSITVDNLSIESKERISEICSPQIIAIYWVLRTIQHRLTYLSSQPKMKLRNSFQDPECIGFRRSIDGFLDSDTLNTIEGLGILQGFPDNSPNTPEILQNFPYLAKHTLVWARRTRPIAKTKDLLEISHKFQELHANYLILEKLLEPRR